MHMSHAAKDESIGHASVQALLTVQASHSLRLQLQQVEPACMMHVLQAATRSHLL